MLNNILANIIGGGGNSTSIIQSPFGSGDKVNLEEATALESDILSGKLAFTKNGLTTGTLPKGMKMASGSVNNIININTIKNPSDTSFTIPVNLSFNPSYVFLQINELSIQTSRASSWIGACGQYFFISNLNSIYMYRVSSSSDCYICFGFSSVSSSRFVVNITFRHSITSYYSLKTNSNWYAFGH